MKGLAQNWGLVCFTGFPVSTREESHNCPMNNYLKVFSA
jgi:hypothetical protein